MGTPGAETTQGAVLGALGAFWGLGGDGAAGIIVEESSSRSLRCCWNCSVDPALCRGELQKAGKWVKNERQLCRVLGQAGGDEQTHLRCGAMGQGCSEQNQGCAILQDPALHFLMERGQFLNFHQIKINSFLHLNRNNPRSVSQIFLS